MSQKPTDLTALLPELTADERRSRPAPDAEEILAYLGGELNPAEEEELQERLALHPESAELLLDLSDPSRLEARDDEDLPLPDQEALRERLRDEGLLEPPLAPVVPMRRGVHPLYRWAAAALLILSAGLSFQLARQAPEPATPDVAFWELLPKTEVDSRRRGDGDEVEAADGFVHDLVLYAPEIDPGEPYRVAVVDEEGAEILVRDVRTVAAGRLILRLEPTDLAPGRYEIHLAGGGDDPSPRAVFPLDWRRP